MNRVCISEAGESNVPNTSRTARTISFDAPPAPPFLPTTNPSNSGACYCSYLCIFPPCTEEIDQKSRFQCANRSFSTKTAAGPCGFFVVPPTPLPPCGLVYVYIYWGICGASRFGCGEMRRKFLGVFYIYKGVMESLGFFRSA